MNQPLISVIVPIYGIERYVGHCIESLMQQTYQNLEIILVDDGSPDHCPQICDLYASKDSYFAAKIRIKTLRESFYEGIIFLRSKALKNRAFLAFWRREIIVIFANQIANYGRKIQRHI